MSMHLLRLAWTAPIVTLAMASSAVAASEPLEDVATADRIIVTGERISRDIGQTASSVTVIASADLERMPDVDRLDQLLDAVPNVVLGSGGQGPTIRGQDTTGVLRDLPAFLGGNRPRATMVVDGRASSYFEFVFGSQPLWDVERVEIFRSPQTTTQGRNAIAGGIFIETRPPEWAWGGAMRGIVGNYDTRQFSAMATGPLIDEQLAFRIAGDVRGSRTSSELTSEVQNIDPNRDEFDLLRIKLLARPQALPGLTIDASFLTSGSQSPQIEGIKRPFAERRDPRVRYGVFRNSSKAITIRPQLELGPKANLSTVLSVGSARARRFAPPGLGEAVNSIEDRAAEVIFTRKDDVTSLLVGVSANRVNLTQTIDLSQVGLASGAFVDEQESAGVFGEIRLSVSTKLDVIAGARYQTDRQERTGALRSQFVSLPLVFARRYSALSPKLSVVYGGLENLSVGLLAQRAANPGGTTLSISSGRLDTFDQERLWNYELFVRGWIPAAGFSFAGNIFYYDIHDGQRSVLTTIGTTGGSIFFQEIGNVPRSRSKGGELQATWSPSASLKVSVAAGFLETRVTESPSDRDPLLGKQFQRSPRFTGSASVNWAPAENVGVNLQYSRRSGYFSDDANIAALRIGRAENLNARLEWDNGSIRIFGFVRNILDSFNLTSLADNGNLATAADPREFGIGAEARF